MPATSRRRRRRAGRASGFSCSWWSAARVAGGATAAWLHFRDRVSSDDANVDGHITAIAPKITGNVVEVAVLDNQPVKAGQVLVRIDPRDYQARVDMAKAALLQAESQARAASKVPLTNDTTQSGIHRGRRRAGRYRSRGGARPHRLRAGLRLGPRLSPKPTCAPSRPATIAPRPTWPA